jgi:hypothetical protein
MAEKRSLMWMRGRVVPSFNNKKSRQLILKILRGEQSLSCKDEARGVRCRSKSEPFIMSELATIEYCLELIFKCCKRRTYRFWHDAPNLSGVKTFEATVQTSNLAGFYHRQIYIY